MTGPGEAALIGLDWGTTSFRAYLLDRDGHVLERRAEPAGILQVRDNDFERVFMAEVGPWLDARTVPVIASGMITSRQGWVETPYLDCPAGPADLANALIQHDLRGLSIVFVPGLTTMDRAGVPDVIRGEETQIAGLAVGHDDLLVVLPGTHSKWIHVASGRIATFRTYMTGEVYGVMRDHSILGRLMDGYRHDPDAFASGVDAVRAAGEGLLHQLFGARTLALFDRLPGHAVGAYLSGLLIGAEVAQATRQSAPRVPVLVGGEARLAERYIEAIRQYGAAAEPAPDDLAARGHFTIAKQAGLIR